MTEEDNKAEAVVSHVLRGGVALAAAVVLVGAALYLFRHGIEKAAYGTFTGEAADLRLPSGILRRAFAGSPRGIIQAGLLRLIATPIARVAASVYLFAPPARPSVCRDHPGRLIGPALQPGERRPPLIKTGRRRAKQKDKIGLGP